MRSLRTILLPLAAWLTTAAGAHGTLAVTIRDISPHRSTLPPADDNGASGGRVNGIGVDRSTPGTLYAASEWGGLFKSTDNGQTWVHLDWLPV